MKVPLDKLLQFVSGHLHLALFDPFDLLKGSPVKAHFLGCRRDEVVVVAGNLPALQEEKGPKQGKKSGERSRGDLPEPSGLPL